MESIFKLDNVSLVVHFDALQQKHLEAGDFLGVTSLYDSEHLRVQDNYFNQMLLGIALASKSEELPPQDGLTAYQQTDLQKSVNLGTFCNFNRMGYGKTVETVVHLRCTHAERVLIVAPKAVLEQWKQHIQEWYPELYPWTFITKSSAALQGTLKFKRNVETTNRKLCIILNYEKLLQGPIISLLRSLTWDMIVFDEAHKLKNRKSKRTIAAGLLPAVNRCILTGTPILAHIDDLWSMLNILGWKYSGQHYWPFVEKFCEIKDDFYGKKIVGPTRNTRDLEHLKQYIDMIAIRNPDLRLTEGKRIITVPLTLDKSQRLFYNKIKKLVIDELPEDLTIANGAVKVVRLRQVTSCPRILDSNPKTGVGVKFEWIKNFVENTEEQILVLTQFASTVQLLVDYLGETTGCAGYYGSLPDSAKKTSRNLFKQGDVQVLVATMQSLGEGVDGLQKNCRLGIVVDADYSPEINAQAEDRLNRIGQSELVCWYYLECEKTFDTRVRKINDCKNKSIRELIVED